MPGHCNSQTFMLISLEFTEQEAVLTLPFEHCGLESLDKDIIGRVLRFFVGHHHPCVYLSLYDITVHMTKPPRPPPSVCIKLEPVKAWE